MTQKQDESQDATDTQSVDLASIAAEYGWSVEILREAEWAAYTWTSFYEKNRSRFMENMEDLLKLDLTGWQRGFLMWIQNHEWTPNYLLEEEIAFRQMFVMLDESKKTKTN